VPVRLREVVYTVSPFEVTILNGLVKDFPGKVMRHLTEVGPCEHAAAQVPLPLHVRTSGRCILTLSPAALQKGPNIAFWCVGPIAAIVWCGLCLPLC
jgi:Cytochrome b-c1 complex subunit 8